MALSRKNLIDYICSLVGTSNVVVLDEFETLNARHICQGRKEIVLLGRECSTISLPDGSGTLDVDYYLCRNCGKLYLNKNNLELRGVTPIVRNVYIPSENPNVVYGKMSGYNQGYNQGYDNGSQNSDYNEYFGLFRENDILY